MKALLLTAVHAPLEYRDIPDPVPAEGHALVSLRAAALNHRDVFITKGLYAKIKFPAILGSDGAGEWQGQHVVIYPAYDWGDDPGFQGKNFRVLGMPDDGTFAEQISVPTAYIFPKPQHLNWEQAAALPMAGLTAWRAVFTRCQLKKGEKVLVSGVGGGVALMAMQFALAAGAEVYVSSGSPEKIQKALDMGATAGANYREADWDKHLKQAAGGFDVIIDSAAGDGFALFPAMCNPGARIGVYGGSLGKVNGLSMQPVFWKQISILGSTVGSPAEFAEMLYFVEKQGIVPTVDSVFDLSQGNAAFEKMDRGEQFGKIVLRVI